MVAARGCCMFVGSDCLQRTAAAGVAWQLSVRCGTASEDGTCGNGIMGHLGLQRTAQLGWATWCGTTSEDGASDFSGSLLWRWSLAARVKQRGEVDLRRWLDCC